MRKFLSLLVAIPILFSAILMPATAQDREVPYWASLNSERVFMRVGPSQDYRIDWVYKRKGLPVKVIRVVDGWWQIRDPDGAEGWVSSTLVSYTRRAMIIGEMPAPMRDAPADNGKLKWQAEPGVVGLLGECEAGWCEIDVGGRVGWTPQDQLWGVDSD